MKSIKKLAIGFALAAGVTGAQAQEQKNPYCFTDLATNYRLCTAQDTMPKNTVTAPRSSSSVNGYSEHSTSAYADRFVSGYEHRSASGVQVTRTDETVWVKGYTNPLATVDAQVYDSKGNRCTADAAVVWLDNLGGRTGTLLKNVRCSK